MTKDRKNNPAGQETNFFSIFIISFFNLLQGWWQTSCDCLFISSWLSIELRRTLEVDRFCWNQAILKCFRYQSCNYKVSEVIWPVACRLYEAWPWFLRQDRKNARVLVRFSVYHNIEPCWNAILLIILICYTYHVWIVKKYLHCWKKLLFELPFSEPFVFILPTDRTK